MSTKYTKAELEELVYAQLENLTAIHDLLHIIKTQNELLHKTNKKLSDEIAEFKHVQYPKPKRKRAGNTNPL